MLRLKFDAASLFYFRLRKNTLNMDPTERVSHPSLAQVEALVQFLEEKPGLAKGFLRSASAKAKALKDWDTLTTKLNSIGGGTIKSTKKWIKYWSDKKNAVKKKASARAAAMRRTGGGVENIPELSEVEERIVALMGGGGFATGDVHLRVQVFDEPSLIESDSPSILAGHSEQQVQPGPITASTSSNFNNPAEPFQVFVENDDLQLFPLGTGHESIIQPLQEIETTQRECTPHPTQQNTVGDAIEGQQYNQSAPSTPRRRRLRAVRRSPPSQRRSQFASITEKFLQVEQQRMALERRIVSVMEQNVEVNRLTAQANIGLGEALKALAEVLKKD